MNKFIIKVIVPLLVLTASFLLPAYHPTFDIPTLLTIVSLIFAILVGFFIAAATTNYLRLQSLVVDEDSTLINIFNLTKTIQPSAISKMQEAIDRYAISALDFELADYVHKTQKEFDEVLSTIDGLSPQDEKGLELFGNIHNNRSGIVRARQEIALVAKRVVTPLHWIVLIFLAILLIFLLWALRDGRWLSSLITSALSLAAYLILILLYEVDSNKFLERLLAYENSQQIFRAIGTMKYFPHHALKNQRIKAPKEDYRVGIFKDYPHSLEKEIKIIRKNS
ncbi:MAG: hypothetical protein V1723_04345 [Candidatus Uhrbacteria bacterium]